jgi:hypothetical protein
MEVRRIEVEPSYTITGMTVKQLNVILRALHRLYQATGDVDAESARVALLGGSLPG